MVAGVLFHAIAGTNRARADVSTVGLGSVLGIVALLLVFFRSWRPLGLSLAAIAVGCLAGFATCLAVFGQVHLLTLVFGASLVGIAVDYALHYFCEHFRLGAAWSPQAALRHIFHARADNQPHRICGPAGRAVSRSSGDGRVLERGPGLRLRLRGDQLSAPDRGADVRAQAVAAEPRGRLCAPLAASMGVGGSCLLRGSS
jgi:hypothetical protein